MEIETKNLSPEDLVKLVSKKKNLSYVETNTITENSENKEPKSPVPQTKLQEEAELSDEEFTKRYLDPKARYTPLAFADPLEFVFWYDDEIASGIRKLHDWQIEELLRICLDNIYTKENPLEYDLVACNGSGKDAYINAVTAVYLTVTKVRHRCICTSASYTQLWSQTESYIRTICFRVNEKYGDKILIVKKGRIACILTGSEIKLYVTDEAGKVEGDHPFPDYDKAEMCMLLNEVKSLKAEIYEALLRCHGYNRWLEISSPGEPKGYFYNSWKESVKYPEKYIPGRKFARKITAYDCPHIPKEFVERKKKELRPLLFNSIFLADFVSLEDEVVIPLENINNLLDNPPEFKGLEKSGGLDLSLGGDETVLAIREGNKLVKLECCRISNSSVLKGYLHKKLIDNEFKSSTPIYTDNSGLGAPIAKDLADMGWNIIPIWNQERAFESHIYANLGTEHWFRLNEHIAKREMILLKDEKLIDQLSTRKIKRPENEKIKLESKKDMRQSGIKSPDRADAVVLAFCEFVYQPKDVKRDIKVIHTQKELLEEMEKNRYSGYSHFKPSYSRKDLITQRRLLSYSLEGYNRKLKK